MFSKAYLKQLQDTHRKVKGWGSKVKNLGEFNYYLDQWKPTTVLDYGCGKGVILNHLKEKYPQIHFDGYDPGINTYSKIPNTIYDCIFSNDVLEHIEPEFIQSVLSHINTLSSNYVWLRIDTIPARKTLSDGRNAHLILESNSWWRNIITLNIDGNIVYENLNSKGKLDFAIKK